MSLFSTMDLFCQTCGELYQTTCNTGAWKRGTCSMRCHYEKEWRYTLSVLGKPYRPDERTFDANGYPVELPPNGSV